MRRVTDCANSLHNGGLRRVAECLRVHPTDLTSKGRGEKSLLETSEKKKCAILKTGKNWSSWGKLDGLNLNCQDSHPRVGGTLVEITPCMEVHPIQPIMGRNGNVHDHVTLSHGKAMNETTYNDKRRLAITEHGIP